MQEIGIKRDKELIDKLLIYIHILKWSGRSEIFVPKIGLADGIIKKLYQDIQKTSL